MKRWYYFFSATLLVMTGWKLGQHMHSVRGAVPLADLMQKHQRCAPGPWGRIVYDYSMIEMTPVPLKQAQENPSATEWKLQVSSPEAVRQQLLAAHFTPEQTQTLLATLTPIAGGYVLHPSDTFILAMHPEVRRIWYAVLAGEPGNPEYNLPPRFRQRTKLTWLQDADVDSHALAMVQRLSFKAGNMHIMADMSLLRRNVSDPDTLQRLTCVLSRENTILTYLLIGPEDNLDQLAEYWGYPDRQDAVRTLLRTTQRSGFDRPIPVSMLLPRFARDRVHRYWRAGDPPWPDCHYTALNFFNDNPDENSTDPTHISAVLDRDYRLVTTAPQLGDIVLFIRGANTSIHACNYIADDIVFTKNGGALGRPWMLARLPDIMEYYSYPSPVRISFLRRRDMVSR
jgi:hypothetical protein